MHFQPNEVYHVYNRGNEKQTIFFSRNNYIFFLRKVRSEWLRYCDILVYCLMPNHFHFLLMPKAGGCTYVVLKEKETHIQNLSKAIGKTLSSYTQAINEEQNRTGNLFQKKTKAKWLSEQDGTSSYIVECGSYIHANPVAAGLVITELDWEYSSARDYYGVRNGTLCNKQLFMDLSGMSVMDFTKQQQPSKERVDSFY